MTTDKLIGDCQGTADAAGEALEWVGDPRNDRKVAHERSTLQREFRRNLLQVRKLERSTQRPSCLAIFGPSQVGKSYLVSRLSARAGSVLAKFDGIAEPIDFIQQINPGGGEESTGLVTRFTITPEPSPPGFPVCLRLLTQSDIIKMLANSCYNDALDETLVRPASDTIEAHLNAYEGSAGGMPVHGLVEEDIWDVEEFFKNTWRATQHPARAFDAYWDRLAKLVPRVPLPERAKLLAPLWGGHDAFTELFLKLALALQQLNFEEDAFCEISSIVPSTTGIVNVKALKELETGGDKLRVATRSGRPVELSRAVVTAVAKELRIVCSEKAWPFFEHMDLLDFPGYRSRTQRNIAEHIRQDKATAIEDLLKRAKVDYLFQRYTTDLELTSMILCLKDSVLEVVSLPEVVETWIGVTHGNTPELRANRPTLLFVGLTYFDSLLTDKAGDAEDFVRFETRLKASLIEKFAPYSSSWPKKWKGDQPFNNCYWIRNPNVEQLANFSRDGRQEVGIVPGREQRLAELGAGHNTAPNVQAHFKDPDRAWRESLTINDGGVSYLAEGLQQVCTPDLKLDQLRSRLSVLRRQMVDRLKNHYVAEDFQKRLFERGAVAQRIVSELRGCHEMQAFGSFLRGLCVNEAQVFSAILDELYRPSAPPIAVPTNGGSRPKATDRPGRIALRAVQHWIDGMNQVITDPGLARRTSLSRENLTELAIELSSASNRQDLYQSIADAVRSVADANDTPQVAARKGALISQRLINQFVSFLGFNTVDPALRPENAGHPIFAPVQVAYETSGITEQAKPFTDTFVQDWLTGFTRLVEDNAKSKDGFVEDPEQNARLGRVLETLSASLKSGSA